MDSQKAKSIFLHALEHIALDEWPNYLSVACGNNPALRNEVEVLLAAHQDDGDLADEARQACAEALPTVESSITEEPGAHVGPYKLREKLGEGGFGVVFVAEQSVPVRRKVALKVIKPGMDSKEVIARFEAERQPYSNAA